MFTQIHIDFTFLSHTTRGTIINVCVYYEQIGVTLILSILDVFSISCDKINIIMFIIKVHNEQTKRE